MTVGNTRILGDVRLLRRPPPDPAQAPAEPSVLLLGEPPPERPAERFDERPTVVDGDLVLVVGRRPVVLELDHSAVTGTVEVAGVWVRRLSITRSRLFGGLRLTRATVAGDVDLTETSTPFVDRATSTLQGRVLGWDADSSPEGGPSAREADTDDTTMVDDAGDTKPPENPFPWETLTQVVGLAAALAAWIAVIGGARFWARADSIGVPPIPLLAGAGQEWLLTEGLQALTLPLVLAATVALAVYFAIPDEPTRDRTTRLGGALAQRLRQSPDLWLVVVAVLVALTVAASWQAVLALGGAEQAAVGAAALAGAGGVAYAARRQGWRLVVLLSLGGLWLAFTVVLGQRTVEEGWLVTMALFTAVVALVAALALTRSGRRGTALAVFVAIVVWSGALSFFYEAGAKHPDRMWARVTLTDATVVQGRLIARSGSRLYLASRLAPPADGQGMIVEVFDNDNIAQLEIAETEVWGPLSATEDGGGSEPSGDAGSGSGGGGSSSGRGGGVSGPTPAAPENADVRVTADLGGSTLHVESRRLDVRNRFLVLDLAVFNPSDVPVVIGTQLSDGEDSDLSSIRIVDTRHRWAYPVARHADGSCVCSDGLDRPLGPHEWRDLTALFRRPDPLPDTVDLRIRAVPWLRSVPVE